MKIVELIGGPKDGEYVIAGDAVHDIKVAIFQSYAAIALPITLFQIYSTVRYIEHDNPFEFVYEEL